MLDETSGFALTIAEVSEKRSLRLKKNRTTVTTYIKLLSEENLLDLEKQIFQSQGPQTIASQSAGQTLDQLRRDVYDSHRHRAFALAYYMTGNEVEAEQMLIRTFTRVFSSPAAPDGAAVDACLFDEM